MILSAGLGTRMKYLTKNIPKPLIKIYNTTLLNNTISFFEKVGCNEFVINTHYLYKQLDDYINLNFSDKNIKTIHEPEILDTGGGIKNAIEFFDNKNFLVTNCDIMWNEHNLTDVQNFLDNLDEIQYCELLLSNKKNTTGINKNNGDFTLKDNYLTRWKKNDEIILFSGLQKYLAANEKKAAALAELLIDNSGENDENDKNMTYGDLRAALKFVANLETATGPRTGEACLKLYRGLRLLK